MHQKTERGGRGGGGGPAGEGEEKSNVATAARGARSHSKTTMLRGQRGQMVGVTRRGEGRWGGEASLPRGRLQCQTGRAAERRPHSRSTPSQADTHTLLLAPLQRGEEPTPPQTQRQLLLQLSEIIGVRQQMASTLAKLDSLSRRLQDKAQLRTHKYFRIAVPGALTGASLVSAIGEVGQAEDDVEATHLASLLLQHGYLFPVIEQSPNVREDGTLYRLQRPYFWPSHATTTDNVEYAIYLYKRLLRNEQKHGLDEDEAAVYNKLAELLAHVWEFITVQAEMQLKQQKEKKKADKVVYDSEERAFWRTRRPGAANCLEEPMQKQERRLRKETGQGYKAKIERMKLSIKTKPWLKAIKASETMVQWVENLQDYDPFIVQTSPPNPWISDDCSLWTLNTDTVEVPTEKRVKRWGLSVYELVRDSIGRQASYHSSSNVLETFLESEFSSENIRFWIAIQDLKYAKNDEIESKAERIYEEFLAPGAPCQVNVDSRTLERTMESLESNASRRHAFFNAEEHVFTLMSKDSYPRFVRSNIYKGVLSAAQQQGSRRLGWRNFVFNMGATTKKMPLTSKQAKMSREDTTHSSLPKQLSSDSLPVRQPPYNHKTSDVSAE